MIAVVAMVTFLFGPDGTIPVSQYTTMLLFAFLSIVLGAFSIFEWKRSSVASRLSLCIGIAGIVIGTALLTKYAPLSPSPAEQPGPPPRVTPPGKTIADDPEGE